MSASIHTTQDICLANTSLAPDEGACVLSALVGQVFDYYHRRLLQSARAKQFLEARGLWQQALVDNYRLGFSDRTLHQQLPSPKTLAGQRTRGVLRRCGLMRSSGREVFEGAIVVPGVNNGNATAAYGQRVTPKLASRCVYHIQWSTMNAGLFNEQALQRYCHLYLCQSPVDALSLLAAGIPNVVSLWGHLELRQLQWQQLELARSLTLIGSDTVPGNMLLGQLSRWAESARVTLRYVHLPQGCSLSKAWQTSAGNAQVMHSLLSAPMTCQGGFQ